jgi:hypothetical protein
VGFFYAIDFTLFSLFSLTEHLSFALLMIPFAVFILLLIALLTTVKKPQGKETPIGIKVVWWADRFLFGLLAAFSWWAYLKADLYSGVGLTIAIGILWRTIGSEKWIAGAIGIVSATFVLALFIGADMATQTILAPEREHIVKTDTNEIKGILLRSGERGLLLYDPKARTPMLLKWDKVNSLTSVPSSADYWTIFWQRVRPFR